MINKPDSPDLDEEFEEDNFEKIMLFFVVVMFIIFSLFSVFCTMVSFQCSLVESFIILGFIGSIIAIIVAAAWGLTCIIWNILN